MTQTKDYRFGYCPIASPGGQNYPGELEESIQVFTSYMEALLGKDFDYKRYFNQSTNATHLEFSITVPVSFIETKKLCITTVGKEDKKRILPKDSPFTPDTTLVEVFDWTERYGLYGSCRKELGLPPTTYQRKMKKAKQLIEKHYESGYCPTLRDLSFIGKEEI